MKRFLLLKLYILLTGISFSQKRQTIAYDGLLSSAGNAIKNSAVRVVVSILRGSASGAAVYTEQHITNTGPDGKYHIEIGNGTMTTGQFDSIVWSDGIFYLRTAIDPLGGTNYSITQNVLMRIPPDLSNDYEQGTVTSSEYRDHGTWRFRNNRNKRPRLITVDLTTFYANLAYPADTYPIYRHYEWCDPDRDGIGNSFVISYSDHTNNDFKENTTILGEVKLYPVPFQQLTLSSTTSEIMISITKPVPALNHGETYAIKGPWKFIYYIEW